MTAWSAARLALKIARLTPSAGSLSESASSAADGSLGAVAQPLQTSSKPSATADADRAALARPAVRTARNTVTFSIGQGREALLSRAPSAASRRRQAAGGNRTDRPLMLAASCVIEQLCGCNVFDRDPDRFEYRRC